MVLEHELLFAAQLRTEEVSVSPEAIMILSELVATEIGLIALASIELYRVPILLLEVVPVFQHLIEGDLYVFGQCFHRNLLVDRLLFD